MRVARTYRLDPGLVLRVEEEADRLGQSLTVFVTRALEQALGSPLGASVSAGSASEQPGPGASFSVARGRAQERPKEEPTASRPSPARASDDDPVSMLPREAYASPLLEAQLRGEDSLSTPAGRAALYERMAPVVEQVSEPFYDDGETPDG